MSAASDDLKPTRRAVHPARHLFIILIALTITLLVDLSNYPELPAILIYEVMLLALLASAAHWFYIARHKTD